MGRITGTWPMTGQLAPHREFHQLIFLAAPL
jgi:hypothetical protein